MNTSNNNLGLKIGSVFTIAWIASVLTFFIPIIAVLPGIFFEQLAKNLVDNEPYSNVGLVTILMLSIILMLLLLPSLFIIKKLSHRPKAVLKRGIILIMLIMSFIIHPLGFYIYWGVVLNFRSDGQLIFGAVKSVPISSITFVIIGLLIDTTLKNIRKEEQANC